MAFKCLNMEYQLACKIMPRVNKPLSTYQEERVVGRDEEREEEII